MNLGSTWFPPVDELGGDKQGDNQAELGVAVSSSAVRISTELAVVAQPGVAGTFDHPAQPESYRLFRCGAGTGLRTPLNVEIVEAATGELGPDFGIVVTPVEVQGLDLLE